MTRAEEAAKRAYPTKIEELHYSDHIEMNGGLTEIDVNGFPRIYFQKGYEQAEKDLVLTISDLELLHTFLYAVKNNKQGCFTFTRLSDEQYKEVLRRFNEARNDRQRKD